jgi:hypothetical protein
MIYLVVCRCCYITMDPETCPSENRICLERHDQDNLHPKLEVPAGNRTRAGDASREWDIAES